MPQRKPRIQHPAYLAGIRSLPCIICGTNHDVEAAHIRFSCRPAGKPLTGAGQKPHDCWTLPLCAQHHQWGPDAQHLSKHSEREWWRAHDIDPIYAAALLWLHFSNDDWEAAMLVVENARALGK